jgi:hypothetical protein
MEKRYILKWVDLKGDFHATILGIAYLAKSTYKLLLRYGYLVELECCSN